MILLLVILAVLVLIVVDLTHAYHIVTLTCPRLMAKVIHSTCDGMHRKASPPLPCVGVVSTYIIVLILGTMLTMHQKEREKMDRDRDG